MSYYYDIVILFITHTLMHTSISSIVSSPKQIKPRKRWLSKYEWEWKTMKVCQKYFQYSFFLLSFFYEGVILVITHIYKCTLALIYNQLSKTAHNKINIVLESWMRMEKYEGLSKRSTQSPIYSWFTITRGKFCS